MSDSKNYPEPTMEPTSSDTLDNSSGFLIADFVEGLKDEDEVSDNDLTCPLTHEYSTACNNALVGKECLYDYAYTGCNLASLSCSPMVECKCEDIFGLGQGRWSCIENLLPSCGLRRSPALPALGEACNPEESPEGSPEGSPVGSPVGSNDGKILDLAEDGDLRSESSSPSQIESIYPSESPSVIAAVLSSESPSTSLTDVQELSTECPSNPSFGECSGYQDGLHCDFEYVYTGCTWDVLQCSPAIKCDCSERIWNCDIDFTTPCKVTVNGHPPGGVPWGEECDPYVPIVIPENVQKKKLCPDTFAFGSCSHFEEGLQCEYNHAYKGCTRDEFTCAPSIICDCNKNSWQCSGDFEKNCRVEDGSLSTPEEFPWGEMCDPFNDDELQQILGMQTKPPSSEPTNAPILSESPSFAPTDAMTVAQRAETLSNVCPTAFRYGQCSNEYINDLECSYNYAYKGCSWEELSCESSIQCTCDHSFGTWICELDFESCNKDGSSVLPMGLPWGETCDPTDDLPTSSP